MLPAIGSHECPLEFLADLASYFQFEWSENRWAIWLKLRNKSLKAMTKAQREATWSSWKSDVAPQFTVRCLAELMARKASVPSFEPVTILGSHCEPAGIFLGLCGLPESRNGRYAPSTPLRALGGSTRICKLWARAEWISGARLPAVKQLRLCRPQNLIQHVRMVAFGLGGFATFIVSVFAAFAAFDAEPNTSSFWLGPALGVTAAGLVMLAISRIAERVHDPLPKEVQTFGDLAKLIAAQGRPNAN
ncbi:hypothetical protein [Lacipirellula parvula]|nr:hypothetical protein [Lacipirellula parvula]